MSAQSALAQNVTDTYLSTTTTDWSTATWSTGAPPVSNNDVLFTTGSAAASTISGENFNIGSFNSTIAETVTNASTTASTLTLGGGSATTDQVAGSNPADLIFVNAGNTLLNGGTTGTGGALNLVLGQNGQFDAAGGSLFIGSTAAAAATGVASTLSLGAFNLTFNSVLSAPNAGNITVFDVISGTGSILKTGNGQASLAGANTFTGGVTIEQGSFNPNNAAGLGAGTAAVALGDATSITNNLSPFLFVSGNTTLAKNVTVGASNAATTGFYTIGSGNGSSAAIVNGAITLNQNLFITTAGGAFTLGATGNGSTLTSGSAGTQTVTFNDGGVQTIGTTIGGGTGTIGVTKVGGGTVTLTAADTYTGATTVNQGTLTLSGSLSASTALALGGGTFNYAPTTAGSTQTVNGLTVNLGNSAVTVPTATNTLNLGAITRNAGGIVSFTPTGTITTTTAATNGILGTYAYTGTTTNLRYVMPNATTGALAAFTGGTAAATAAGVTDTTGTANYDVAAAGTVGAGASANTVRYTGAAGTVAGPVTLNGLMNAGTGALTVSGPVTVGANNYLVVLANTQNTNITGVIGDGAAPSALTYGGAAAGVLTLSGINTYTGGTNVASGTVALAGGDGNGNGNIRGVLTVGTGATVNLTGNNALGFTAGGNVTTVNVGLAATVNSTVTGNVTSVNQGFLTNFNLTGGTVSSGGGGSYNFNVGATTAPTISSNASTNLATFSAPIVIRNNGTLAFNVASGVIGQDPRTESDLTVSGTILKDNVTTTSVGGISKSGAGILTLSGVNTYNGGTLISAGTLLTNVAGTLGTGNVTLTGTGALTLNNTGTSVATVNTATLNFAGTTKITLNNVAADTLFNIIDTDTGAAPLVAGTYNAQALDAAFGVTSFIGGGLLTVSVPEPSTWLGGLMVVGTFGFALRRRMGARTV